MKTFDTVAIVGTGLIGGSLALALKQKKLARRIIGLSLHKKSLRIALRTGCIDESVSSLRDIGRADLIVLATPPGVLRSQLPEVARYAKPGCLVFDVASIKESIVSNASPRLPGFVGCHPLAGSEKRGIAFARADLFCSSLCIITPVASTDQKALQRVRSLWAHLGAKVLMMSPRVHDTVLASVSHLPHLIAFALMNAIPQKFLPYAPQSLKETTRVASSESSLWADIILENRCHTLRALSAFQNNVSRITKAMRTQDPKALARLFETARQKRKNLRDYRC